MRYLIGVIVSIILITVIQVAVLRWVNPPRSMFMLEREASAWRHQEPHFVLRNTWCSFSEISSVMPLAVIASEDQRFLLHHGFDFDAIRHAEIHNAHSVSIHGASTISQQVAKNLFLWPGRSYIRKVIEAWYTVLIETMWSKRRIMEMYLNIAEFGNGIYGVGAAAKQFWHTDAAHLTTIQASLLAAVLPSPRRLHADHPDSYTVHRAAQIAIQMQHLRAERQYQSLVHH